LTYHKFSKYNKFLIKIPQGTLSYLKIKNNLSNNKQKGQSRKIIILLSYSVLLPERFFLEN